jgi:hypothetical protein
MRKSKKQSKNKVLKKRPKKKKPVEKSRYHEIGKGQGGDIGVDYSVFST